MSSASRPTISDRERDADRDRERDRDWRRAPSDRGQFRERQGSQGAAERVARAPTGDQRRDRSLDPRGRDRERDRMIEREREESDREWSRNGGPAGSWQAQQHQREQRDRDALLSSPKPVSRSATVNEERQARGVPRRTNTSASVAPSPVDPPPPPPPLHVYSNHTDDAPPGRNPEPRQHRRQPYRRQPQALPLSDPSFADCVDDFLILFTDEELDAEPFLRDYVSEVLARWGRWTSRGRAPHLCFEAATLGGMRVLEQGRWAPSERTDRVERSLAIAMAGLTVDALEPNAAPVMRAKAVLLLGDEFLARAASPKLATPAKKRARKRRSRYPVAGVEGDEWDIDMAIEGENGGRDRRQNGERNGEIVRGPGGGAFLRYHDQEEDIQAVNGQSTASSPYTPPRKDSRAERRKGSIRPAIWNEEGGVMQYNQPQGGPPPGSPAQRRRRPPPLSSDPITDGDSNADSEADAPYRSASLRGGSPQPKLYPQQHQQVQQQQPSAWARRPSDAGPAFSSATPSPSGGVGGAPYSRDRRPSQDSNASHGSYRSPHVDAGPGGYLDRRPSVDPSTPSSTPDSMHSPYNHYQNNYRRPSDASSTDVFRHAQHVANARRPSVDEGAMHLPQGRALHVPGGAHDLDRRPSLDPTTLRPGGRSGSSGGVSVAQPELQPPPPPAGPPPGYLAPRWDPMMRRRPSADSVESGGSDRSHVSQRERDRIARGAGYAGGAPAQQQQGVDPRFEEVASDDSETEGLAGGIDSMALAPPGVPVGGYLMKGAGGDLIGQTLTSSPFPRTSSRRRPNG
ncbi:hypothetical protein HK101_003759 [Irineochytrium annulatum]|nr:hypothetical protein HK101_003759 [Irineochytrium annulatum]